MKRIIELIVLCFIIVPMGFAQNPVVKWETLPEIREGVKIRSFSSYNPTGRTFRDFRNYNDYENRTYFLASNYGTRGMLVGLWFTSLGGNNLEFGRGRFGDVSLFFSNDVTADYKKQREIYFEDSKFPHLKPFFSNYSQIPPTAAVSPVPGRLWDQCPPG